MIEVETTEWRAKIFLEAGGNLSRLLHRPSGIEVLRTPPSLEHLRAKPEVYGIPVLLPPNRIDGGRFSFQGRNYELPLNEPERGNHLHGLVLARPWHLKNAACDYVELGFDFMATSGFPHDFSLSMSYRFTPEAVVQLFNITNRSSLPMPFGLGFHTTFNLPAAGRVKITVGEGHWEIVRPRCLPSGKLLPWDNPDGVFDDHRAISCHCPMNTEVIDGKPFRGIIITYPANTTKLYYEVDDQYRHWCLWNDGGGQGFFCAEPMTCMVNAPNLDLPAEVTGLQILPPATSQLFRTVIAVRSR